MSQLSIPGKVYWKTSQEFCQESLLDLKNKRVLLFISASSAERLSLLSWINALKANSILVWIDKIPSNPTYKDIFNVLQSYYIDEAPEVIIAIGGGSTIDMAKSFLALWYLKNGVKLGNKDVLNSIRTKNYLNYKQCIPIYAVPTTAGTGSEVTRWATVWDNDEQVKYSIEASWLCPKRAYIVPEYTVFMPRRLTLSTGLDALSQAIEAYWAKSSNLMVRELSKVSIRLIVEYLPKVLIEPDNMHYREKMCLGSTFSGLAFSNTRTTACHSISYPLTMRFGIEHGLACALSLAKVMQINFPMIEDVDGLMDALGVTSPEDFQKWLDNVTGDIVCLRLSAFGICEEDIDELTKMSFTQGRMDNNPVDLGEDEVKDLLLSLF